MNQPCKKASDVTWYCDTIKTEIIGEEPCAECPHREPDIAQEALDGLAAGRQDPELLMKATTALSELIEIRELAKKAVNSRSAKNREEYTAKLQKHLEQ